MYRIYLLLCAVALIAGGCTKKGQTVSTQPVEGRPVAPSTNGRPVFVTDQPSPTVEITSPSTAAPVEIIEPITFASRETEHVRIVDYNPFGEASELVLDLDQLRHFFCYPYPGNKISDYGMRGRAMHTGLDIKAIPNDTVRAALGGVVRMSKEYSGYGNIVVIRHPCGLETAYSHNSKNLVRPNDVVRAGDPIALAGRTGRATTEHVHFETRMMGEHFDPNLFLDTQNRTIQSGKIHLLRRNGRITASNSAASNTALMASNAQRTGSTAGSSSVSAPDVYTVQRGDTLYSISRRYGLTVSQLCSLNDISAEGVLSVGQKLKMK